METTTQKNTTPTFFEKMNLRIKNSISIRLFLIAIIALVLLIPASMVEGLIREREHRKDDVVQRINKSWGDMQRISGPLITIPYSTFHLNSEGERVEVGHQAHFLPEELRVNGDILTKEKYISLFRSVVYTADLLIEARFSSPDFTEWGVGIEDVHWEEAIISMGLTDLRGIQERLIVDWNGSSIELGPGSDSQIFDSAVSAPVELDGKGEFDFSLNMKVNGSEQLRFYPLGRETQVELSSSWSHPNFEGAFPADEQEISPEGFRAQWKILSLNRNFPQQWRDTQYGFTGSSFGLGLVTPVDDYQKSFRSVKYALMMIAFTFLIFFFLEIRSGKRVHPIQFILVGLALIVFYTLLVSMTEHIGFNYSYGIACVAVSLLISIYFQAIFKEGRMTLIMVLTLGIMYGFVFVTLQLMDYALLIGSIGLFVALAVVMMLSRKVDWYALSDPNRESKRK